MATLTWLGTDAGNEGRWDIPANWSTTGSVAAIPVDGDDVVFGLNAQSITGGLDQNAVELNSLAFSNLYTGSVGANSTPLEIDALILTYAGQGTEAWIAGVFPQLDVNDAASGADSLHLSVVVTGKLTISAGRTVTLDGAISSIGGSYAPTASVVAELIVQSRPSLQSPTVIIESGCTITTLRVENGTVTCSSPVATIEIYGGQLTVDSGDVTIWRQSGGVGTWTAEGATITDLEARGGVFNASTNVAVKTITELWMYSGFNVQLDNSALTIVVGTFFDYSDGQGTLKLDPGFKFQPI